VFRFDDGQLWTMHCPWQRVLRQPRSEIANRF
jgi:hypothetical protein